MLLASIGLTALAVVDAQRAVRSQQAVTQRALREYATFAAWSYAQHLNEVLTTLLRAGLSDALPCGTVGRATNAPS